MEVYVDDMLVKSPSYRPHPASKTFALLQADNVKLNPKKCTFAMTTDKFLRYLVTQRGIEDNPDHTSTIPNRSHLLVLSPKAKWEARRFELAPQALYK